MPADALALDRLQGPIAVVCHDAGAANQLFAWLATRPGLLDNCRAFVEGPAARLWASRFPTRPACTRLVAALDGAATLLSGTGWASELEHRARQLAHHQDLSSIAVIDHWVNYRERFVRAGKEQLPDQIWVADADALALAVAVFPELPVQQLPNSYLVEQLQDIAPPAAADDDILVVLEPARSTWGRDVDGEFQALDYLVSQLPQLGAEGSRLRLRPHPSDPPGKYQAWLARQRQGLAKLDNAPTLAAAISACRSVAGCESYAMVVALAAGRRVICTLPPWAPPSRLPHQGLIHLRHLTDQP